MAAANKKAPPKRPDEMERLKEPKKYVAGQTLFVEGRRIRKGKVFYSDLANPGIHWIPFDKAKGPARRAKEAEEAAAMAEKEADQKAADALMAEREGGNAGSADDEGLADGKD